MSVGRRIFHGVLAVAAAWFLFICLIQAPAAERPLSLLLLVVASLVWFARSGSLLALAVILPLGPILNFPFLTPDRGIYATEVVLLGAVVAKGIRWLLAGRPSAENLPRSSHRVPVLLWVGFAVAGLAA